MKLFQNLALIAAGLVASVVVINSNQSAQAAGITLSGPTSGGANIYDFDLNIPADTNFGPNSTVSIFYQGTAATEDASSSPDFSFAGTSPVDIGGITYQDAVFSTASDLTSGSPADYTLALDSPSFTYAGNTIIATNPSSPGNPTVTNSGTVPVPEPGAIGGSAIALGLGAWLKRKKALSV